MIDSASCQHLGNAISGTLMFMRNSLTRATGTYLLDIDFESTDPLQPIQLYRIAGIDAPA